METNTQINGVIILRSYYESIAELDNDDRLTILDAIMQYGLEGTLPTFAKKYLNSIWIAIKPNIDNGLNRRQKSIDNGKKGGRPKTSKPVEPTKQIITETKESVSKEDVIKVKLVKYLKGQELLTQDEERLTHMINNGELTTPAEITEQISYIL